MAEAMKPEMRAGLRFSSIVLDIQRRARRLGGAVQVFSREVGYPTPRRKRPNRLPPRAVSFQLPLLLLLALPAVAQKRPLAEQDIADITTLVMLEDRRDFNAEVLGRIVRSEHPEVRRRAAMAIARINDRAGRPLLRTVASDADSSVAASAVFGVGQLRDSSVVAFLETLLIAPATPVTVAFEAARALGKIRTPESRAALARYLRAAVETPRTRSVIGEALLSIGRHTMRDSILPIARFTRSLNEETRWRATWALFRPRDPAAIPELLRLTRDPSAHVRSWAIRALSAAQVDTAKIMRDEAVLTLLAATRHPDRRVRTEAIRTMITYEDSATFSALVRALDDKDAWISVSAAEALARRTNRAEEAIAALSKAAIDTTRPSALRIVATQSLLALSPESARAPAELLAQDSLPLSKTTATTIQGRLAAAGNPARGGGAGRAGGGGGGGGGRGQQRPLDTGKTETDYRAIVERWIVPTYYGTPRPRVQWSMGKGTIELELYADEAPLATEDFMKVMATRQIVGTAFTRVVPDFVDQQQGIYNDHTLRDEVTRLGLTRANLSWASAGLDTGRPGYTLGHTPQPHNEGDFTTLGHVVRGMDVVDRIDLGDRITGVRILVR
jgi:HEAT repeat protein/cyclophilin family peptidyl-prolyl cis-trans isomerase